MTCRRERRRCCAALAMRGPRYLPGRNFDRLSPEDAHNYRSRIRPLTANPLHPRAAAISSPGGRPGARPRRRARARLRRFATLLRRIDPREINYLVRLFPSHSTCFAAEYFGATARDLSPCAPKERLVVICGNFEALPATHRHVNLFFSSCLGSFISRLYHADASLNHNTLTRAILT